MKNNERNNVTINKNIDTKIEANNTVINQNIDNKINSNNILFINIFIFKGKSTTILQMNNNQVVFS